MAREVTLNVPQGIGDIFWIYQKFSKHYDHVNFNIMSVPESAASKVTTRAYDWLFLLPKVARVGYVTVTAAEYRACLSRRYPMKDILLGGPGPFVYSVNKPLEEGMRLEAIDPDFETEWNVPVRTEPSVLAGREYVILYVSATFANPRTWGLQAWLELTDELYKYYNWPYQLAVIGASFDKPAVTELSQALTAKKLRHTVVLDAPAAQAADILKNAKYLIGYQSGLSILADNFNVPQLMLYAAKPPRWMAPQAAGRRLLMYSWPKQANIDNGTYQAATFAMTPPEVIDRVRSKQIAVPAARDVALRPESPITELPPAPPPIKHEAVVIGHLGDFIAAEATLTDEERESIDTVYYATPSQERVQQFIARFRPFPKLKHEVVVFNRFTDVDGNLPSFKSKNDLRSQSLLYRKFNVCDLLDLSPDSKGNEFSDGKRAYTSSCVTRIAAPLPAGLPKRYVAIQAYSARLRRMYRDFTEEEWRAVMAFLERQHMTGVVLNAGLDNPPKHKLLIDLNNKLDVAQAVSVVSAAAAFIGCCSWLSVVAAKVLSASALVIKGPDDWRNTWGRFYYAPHPDPCFVFPNLQFLSLYGPEVRNS